MNLRFPGQYYDRETGTHYNYFRDYSPQTGRYIQRDPIGLNAGVNVYGYVNGNPLIHSDFLGLFVPPEPQRMPISQKPPVSQIPAANNPSFAQRTGTAISLCAVRASVFVGLLLLPSSTSSCDVIDKRAECYNDSDCEAITRKIEAQKNEIIKRYFALLVDQHNLYANPLVKLTNRKGSWIGHINKYYDQQAYLKKLIAEAQAKRCPVDLSAFTWAEMPPPPSPVSR